MLRTQKKWGMRMRQKRNRPVSAVGCYGPTHWITLTSAKDPHSEVRHVGFSATFKLNNKFSRVRFVAESSPFLVFFVCWQFLMNQQCLVKTSRLLLDCQAGIRSYHFQGETPAALMI